MGFQDFFARRNFHVFIIVTVFSCGTREKKGACFAEREMG